MQQGNDERALPMMDDQIPAAPEAAHGGESEPAAETPTTSGAGGKGVVKTFGGQMDVYDLSLIHL